MTNPDIDTLSELGAIAVVGMSGEFSGCRNIDEFWSLIQSGKSAGRYTSPQTATEMGMSDSKTKNEQYVPWSMPIEDIDQFDARAFDMNDAQAQTMDPQCRRFLQACWNGIENAGYNPMKLRELNAGIVACSNPNGYLSETVSTHLEANHHAKALQVMTGNQNDFLATWAAYKLDLTGPALTVQTACSSSLVAIANACLQLQTYQADMMIAGGSALSLPQDLGYVRQQGSILSQDGQCSPFSVEASGTLNGHTVATVVLKRVEDAIADGDHIWAVIRGAGINNDGRTKMDFMAPGVEGQSAVMHKALQLAELPAEHIQYIETHGTGTQLGDEIEIRALSEVYGKSGATQYLGAVKSNIGHANAGAGIAGFIKTVLSLYYGKIAPNAGNTQPNPAFGLDSFQFILPNQLIDWPACECRRAAISSLGFGGTNAHLIIEQAPRLDHLLAQSVAMSQPFTALTLSGTSESSVQHQLTQWQTWLKQKSPTASELQEVSQSLLGHRYHFNHRVAVIGDSWQELEKSIRSGDIIGGAEQLVLAFTGQGAQWRDMGLSLYQKDPVFRQVTDQCDGFLQREWDIAPAAKVWQGEVAFDSAFSRASAAHYYQFCYQFAMAKSLIELGIEFDVLIGHSLGEFSAAVISCAISLEEAVWLVFQRGLAIETCCLDDMSMMAVNLGRDELLKRLPDNIDLAVVNSDKQCVVAGTDHALQVFSTELEALKCETKRLQTTHGFHSRQMKAAKDTFRSACERVKFHPVQSNWISALTGKIVTHVDTDYWVNHLTETVRFDLVLDRLCTQSVAVIECGGRSVLSRLVRSVSHERPVTSSFSSHEEWRALVQAKAIAFSCDRLVNKPQRSRKYCIPVSCFDTTRYWSEDTTHDIYWRGEITEPLALTTQLDEDDELTLWLKTLWQNELGKGTKITEHSDFYTLGGNSLAAIQICDQIERQLGVSLPISHFLNQRSFGQFMKTLLILAEEQAEEMESIQ